MTQRGEPEPPSLRYLFSIQNLFGLELPADEAQHRLRKLVHLRQHRRARLGQDLELREVQHLQAHIRVADSALRRRQVRARRRQVRQSPLCKKSRPFEKVEPNRFPLPSFPELLDKV